MMTGQGLQNRVELLQSQRLRARSVEVPVLSCPGTLTSQSAPQRRCSISDEATESRTTLVLKNLPRHFDKEALKSLLEKLGFRGFFDFLYVPLQWNQESCVGYGLVNLTSPEVAGQLWEQFERGGAGAEEDLEVCWDAGLKKTPMEDWCRWEDNMGNGDQ
eukprot:s126_g48.t1